MKIGIGLLEWAGERKDPTGRPAMSGASHIRFGQYEPWLEPGALPGLSGHEYFLGEPVYDHRTGTFGVNMMLNPDQFPDPNDLSNVIPEERDIVVDLDVVILKHIMDEGTEKHVYTARSNGQIILQDIDDHMWAIPDWNGAFYAMHPDVNKESNVYHMGLNVDASDGIIASTPTMAEEMKRIFDLPTVVADNHVDVDKFLNPREVNDVPRLGWTGGIALKGRDLEQLKPWANSYPWVHGGHSEKAFGAYGASFQNIVGVEDVQTHPSTIISEYPAMFTFDVGTVPLKQCVFNDCKSWIKGIEYSAAGLPFIATPVAEYRRLHEILGIGFLARGTPDWVKYAKRLLNEVSLG